MDEATDQSSGRLKELAGRDVPRDDVQIRAELGQRCLDSGLTGPWDMRVARALWKGIMDKKQGMRETHNVERRQEKRSEAGQGRKAEEKTRGRRGMEGVEGHKADDGVMFVLPFKS